MTDKLFAAIILLGTAFIAIPAQAFADDGVCENGLTDTPERLYDFKVGNWDIHWKNKMANGTFFEFDAKGHAYRAMEGDILLDEQRSDIFKGMTFRTYNPKTEEWVVRWFPANDVFPHPISARLEDCTPVERHKQTIGNGQEVMAVTRFTNIAENRFEFHQDWSFDEGKTWVPDILYYEATRITG